MRIAIDGGAGTEHECFDVRRLHGLQQADSALDIVCVVIDRLRYRLPYCFKSSEVYDGLHLILFQRISYRASVAYVSLYKRRGLTRNASNTLQHNLLAIGEVIQYAYMKSSLHEQNCGVTPNISRTSS